MEKLDYDALDSLSGHMIDLIDGTNKQDNYGS